MRRKLLILCSGVFLLPWVASYGFPFGERWTHPRGRFACFVTSTAGRLDVAFQTVSGAPAPLGVGSNFTYEITEAGRVAAFIRGMRADDAYVAVSGEGMGWRSARGNSMQIGSTMAVRLHVLAIPYWLLALACLAPVLLTPAIRRKLARRRAARGQCARCGYDLRASPERCPECGAVPTGVPGAAA